MSKQTDRRIIARLKADLYGGKPWSIDAKAMSFLLSAVDSGDIEECKAAMSTGTENGHLLGLSPTPFNVFSSSENGNGEKPANQSGVKVIPIVGVLQDENDWWVRYGGATSYQSVEKEFKAAIDASDVSGILFYCDSPGGAAIGVKRLADLIYTGRGNKPIVSYVQGICGSAAYYLASAADEILSTADSLIGSIGTIFPHMEVSKALEDHGIKYNIFTNTDSPKKGHGNIYEQLSDPARETLQNFTDSYGRPFIEDVSRHRDMSTEQVIENFGKGDAFVATEAIKRGLIDEIVTGFDVAIESVNSSIQTSSNSPTPPKGNSQMKISRKLKAVLKKLGLISSMNATHSECMTALRSWFAALGKSVPSDEAAIFVGLNAKVKSESDEDEPSDDDEDNSGTVANEEDEDEPSDEEDDEEPSDESDEDEPTDDEDEKEVTVKVKGEIKGRKKAKSKVARVREAEFAEAKAESRLTELRASQILLNEVAGYDAITAESVIEEASSKKTISAISNQWQKTIAATQKGIRTSRVNVTGYGGERYVQDAVDGLLSKCASSLPIGPTGTRPKVKLSEGARQLSNAPLWAIAAECLNLNGHKISMLEAESDRENTAQMAMEQHPGRVTFFSAHENRQYISAAGPTARPGDFPGILSELANRMLDMIELDEWSYPDWTAVLPGGLPDFRPGIMINKGISEELDILTDAETLKDVSLGEEVLSYIFLKRYGNRWGWTPVMVANDDLGAFVEGMLGLDEAWKTTQNRLCFGLLTANANLLDGNALFANRTTGTGTGNNDQSSGAAPSDTEWSALEVLYADFTGVSTSLRVRGTLNTILVPSGTAKHEAMRTFAPLNAMGLENKDAATTANIGLYRGTVKIVVEPELRDNSALIWYAMRNPTALNTATVIRAYFAGYGEGGRRERWYDPTDKTTWVSIEGRIGAAIKNWRYIIRDAGA